MNRTRRHIIRLLTILAVSACANLTLAAPDADENVVVPRVARISYIEGSATMQRTTDEAWTDAAINIPLTIGDKIYSGIGGRVEIQLEDDTAVRLGNDTYIHFANMEDDLTRIGVMKGTVSVHAKEVNYTRAPIEIKSELVHARINEWANARFNIDENGIAEVMVRRGRVDVDRGGDGFFYLRRGDQLKITGHDPASFTLQTIDPEDGFDQWCDMRDAMQASSITAKYLSTRMAGYSDLDYYGDWVTVPDYGRVWRPRAVVDDWAPYRDGRWVWRDYCGWVWVSYEPWGWTPYHYGRWVYADRHWCWAPHSEIIIVDGPRYYHWPRPVWYPSLVSFTYARHGRYFSYSVGGGYYDGPCVGWFPLGPYDHYDYWHHYHRHGHGGPGGPGSGNIIAAGDVTINNGIINNNTTIYQNQAAPNALTVMPQRDFGTNSNTKPAVASLNPSHIRDNSVEVGPETGLKISPPRAVASKSENADIINPNVPGRAKTARESMEYNRGMGKVPREANVTSSGTTHQTNGAVTETKTAVTASPSRTEMETKREAAPSAFDRPSVINDVKRTTTTSKPERSERNASGTVQPSQYSAPRSVETSPSRESVPTDRTVSPSRSTSDNATEQRSSLIQDTNRATEPSRTESRTRAPLTRDYSSSQTPSQTDTQTSTSPSRSRFNYDRDTRMNVITTPSRSSSSSDSNRSPYVVIPRSSSSSSSSESSRSSAFSSPSYNPPRTIEVERSNSSYDSTPSRTSRSYESYSPSRSSSTESSRDYQSSSPSRSSSSGLSRDYQINSPSRSSSGYQSTSPSRSSSSRNSRDTQTTSPTRSSDSYRSYNSSQSNVSPSRSLSSEGRSSSSSSASSSRSISPSRSDSTSPSRSSSPARSSSSSGSTSSPRR